MKQLAGQRVLVLGLGHSGLAMARWCAGHGARVQVWDSRDPAPQADALRVAAPDAELFSGMLDAARLDGVALVLKSPGLAPHDERIAGLLQAARTAGVAIGNELTLFIQALADLKAERRYAPKLLAVTGTNGKTTTTAMAALLVERCGRRVAAAGNIGPTMLDTLAAALALEPPPAEVVTDAAALAAQAVPGKAPVDAVSEPAELPAMLAQESSPIDTSEAIDDEAPLQLAPPPPAEPVFEYLPEVWVLELSSFQLDGVTGFEPDSAAVLNVTQDHLDWHGDMEAYAAAKARIFGQRAVMVINRDDLRVEAMVPAPVMFKGGRGKRSTMVGRRVSRFGLDAPQRPGDFGLVTEGGMAWLVRALEADETIRRKSGEEEEIHLQRLMPADALRVRGRHNAANALAALALAVAIGCPLAPMLHGLREYHGEPHRVEFVASVGGVEAYDDSKGTNVGATVAALDGLGLDKAPSRLVVILGGDGKGQDFSPLLAPLIHHARAVALIGRDAEAIATAIADSGVTTVRHADLPQATRWSFEQARPGDAVLLSPACASLDMFRNYGHRAEVFIDTVRALAADRGEAA